MSKLTKNTFDIDNCSDWTLNQLKEFAAEINASRKTGTKDKICEAIEKRLKELKKEGGGKKPSKPSPPPSPKVSPKKPSNKKPPPSPKVSPSKDLDDLDDKGITELKKIAKEMGVSGYSKYNSGTKDELIILIKVKAGKKLTPPSPKVSPKKPSPAKPSGKEEGKKVHKKETKDYVYTVRKGYTEGGGAKIDWDADTLEVRIHGGNEIMIEGDDDDENNVYKWNSDDKLYYEEEEGFHVLKVISKKKKSSLSPKKSPKKPSPPKSPKKPSPSKSPKKYKLSDIDLIGINYTGPDKFGDFGWMIEQSEYNDSLFVFNDNQEDWGTDIVGGGNAVIRPYSKKNPPRAVGISTGSKGKGYQNLKYNRVFIDMNLATLKHILLTNKYKRVYWIVNKEGLLGTGIFNVDSDVINYISNQLKTMGMNVIFNPPLKKEPEGPGFDLAQFVSDCNNGKITIEEIFKIMKSEGFKQGANYKNTFEACQDVIVNVKAKYSKITIPPLNEKPIDVWGDEPKPSEVIFPPPKAKRQCYRDDNLDDYECEANEMCDVDSRECTTTSGSQQEEATLGKFKIVGTPASVAAFKNKYNAKNKPPSPKKPSPKKPSPKKPTGGDLPDKELDAEEVAKYLEEITENPSKDAKEDDAKIAKLLSKMSENKRKIIECLIAS